jgi:hypothetical protein
MPSSFGICFIVMIRARPNTNPVSTEGENNRATPPRRNSPATSEMSPARMASAAVSSAYFVVPVAASWLIVAAEVIATADDTATTR